MNIMIITHSYVPSISPRALRWSAIAEKWAQQGHTVVVLCGNEAAPRGLENIDGVQVYRIEGLFFDKRRVQLGGSYGQSAGGNARLLKKLYDLSWKKIYWPDYACLWYYHASKKADKIMRRKTYDVVITASLPFTDHLVGLSLKKRYREVPWMVDVGDPFSFAEMRHLNNHLLYGKLNYKTERHVFRKADWITVTTEATACNYRKIFPESAQKIYVIPPLLTEAGKTDEVRQEVFDKDKINISYIGNFYRFIREPDNLLSLVSELLRGSPRLKEKVRLHIFGNSHLFYPAFEGYKDLSRICLLHGPVKRPLVDQIIRESDMLINLGNTTAYQLPSKIVEYAASGKPILNICNSESDSSLRFLRDYTLVKNVIMGGGKLSGPVEDVIEFIEKKYDQRMNGRKLKNFIKPYQLARISDQYYSIICSKQNVSSSELLNRSLRGTNREKLN